MDSAQPHHPPDPVLVLSGGGSLGAAQVGVLRPLYRGGFRPAAIVGTSIGAINGAFLASYEAPESVERLRQVWLSLGAHQIFSRNPWRLLRSFLTRRSCLFDGTALLRLMETHLPADDFAAVRVPFYATATNSPAARRPSSTRARSIVRSWPPRRSRGSSVP